MRLKQAYLRQVTRHTLQVEASHASRATYKSSRASNKKHNGVTYNTKPLNGTTPQGGKTPPTFWPSCIEKYQIMVVMGVVVPVVEVAVVAVRVVDMTCVDKENCFWLFAAAFCSTHSSRENTSITCRA